MIATGPASPSTRVTGGIDLARLARALSPALTAAEDKLGEAEVAKIQESISRPVVVTIGPLGGEHVQRSSPGDPPRMDFGVLVHNVKHEVVPASGGAGLPYLHITSSRPATNNRDRGTSSEDAPLVLERELHRPYMSPAFVRLKAAAVGFFQKFMP